jgi:hypothetical protein
MPYCLSEATLRPSPIFDTNVFGDVQCGRISKTDWNYALRRRPGHGWPLSNVTALELLVAVDAAPQHFPDVRDRIALAYNLSKGRIFEDPRFLLCKEVLGVPFPPDLLPPSASTVSRYMDLIRRAKSLDELLSGGVLYRGRRQPFKTTAVLGDLMAGPKRRWVKAVEQMATERHPEWRRQFEKTGKRLPSEMRKDVESELKAQRRDFIVSLLAWLGLSNPPPQAVTQILKYASPVGQDASERGCLKS